MTLRDKRQWGSDYYVEYEPSFKYYTVIIKVVKRSPYGDNLDQAVWITGLQ